MTRAAVVLFVDSESGGDEVDLASLVSLALQEQRRNGLKVTVQGVEHSIRVVNVMEAGTAIGNGYLWGKLTSKAWHDRGLD